MTIALIVAAGRGERLGSDRPKALVELAGVPMLQWSIRALEQVQQIQRIVVALPPATPPPPGVVGVEGGSTRSQSVARALAAGGEGDPVLVHDAARPLLTPDLARAVIAALDSGEHPDAAIAAAPVTNTIKRANEQGVVLETIDRNRLWAVQTPQVFRRGALERALDVSEQVLAAATDDAWLVERSGGKVVVVAAGDENLKVTTALDLQTAATLLGQRGTLQS